MAIKITKQGKFHIETNGDAASYELLLKGFFLTAAAAVENPNLTDDDRGGIATVLRHGNDLVLGERQLWNVEE